MDKNSAIVAILRLLQACVQLVYCTVCTRCTCATANIYLLLSRYKNLIQWVSKLRSDRKERLPSNWEHPSPLFDAFKIALGELGSKQILVRSDYNGKVGVCWDLDEFFQYISTQDDILDTMTFPLLDRERPYVFIIRGDGFPSTSKRRRETKERPRVRPHPTAMRR